MHDIEKLMGDVNRLRGDIEAIDRGYDDVSP